jgi:alcohol dehydrogenase YqhD (iron-dependent ADH family)
MGENGILKLGKKTDFQNHMIEHQLGAYTDCNHGQGLAVIHPAVYRHLVDDNTAKFARWARQVWGLSGKNRTEKEQALAGIQALQDFIKEIKLPSTLSELKAGMRPGSPDPTDADLLKKVADSVIISPGCARQLSHEEIYQILLECR